MSAIAQSEQDALAELARNLADPMWRIGSGKLYKIVVKTEGEGGDLVMAFRPNRAQRRFIKRLHHKNIILKARQLGFTTLIAIVWLDHALFNANVKCGIIAQDRETAESIFQEKVMFAYDNLPPALKAGFPLKTCTKSQVQFGHNNSIIRVATSVRGGTIHRLHISEFGKICAKFPDKAAEVVTGSIPAVPDSGILVIESTVEGRDGEFYEMTQQAIALHERKKTLTDKDYRFHFFAWWQDPDYWMDPDGVEMSEKDHEYFDNIEAVMDTTLDEGQRAWYVGTRDSKFKTKPERMWQEYPSTPAEAFQKSAEGTYYAREMTSARKQGRITRVPHVPGIPVNTFWDIGKSDGTAIWFHQRVGMWDHWIKFIEGWDEPYSYYAAEMQKLGWVWGKHHLPHDGNHTRQGEDYATQLSPKEMLEKLGLRNVVVVERVPELIHGIQAVRDCFSRYVFDAEGCKEGLVHIEMYRKSFNMRTQAWTNAPFKDIHTEAADALRQHAQGYSTVMAQTKRRAKANHRTT